MVWAENHPMTTPVTVSVKGPIFDGASDDELNDMAESTVRELASLGVERLATTLRPRPGGVYLSVTEAQKGKASTGNYRRHLHQRVKGPYAIITDGGVIYGPWLEGEGTRNLTTRFKGYASFRRVGQWMREITPQVLRRQVERFARRMNR